MRHASVGDEEAKLRLGASVLGLADRVPLVSAQSLLTKGQRRVLLATTGVLVLGLAVDAVVTVTAFVAVMTPTLLSADDGSTDKTGAILEGTFTRHSRSVHYVIGNLMRLEIRGHPSHVATHCGTKRARGARTRPGGNRCGRVTPSPNATCA